MKTKNLLLGLLLLTSGYLSAQWLTNGSNIYYNSGNVGIGTANPNTLLTLNRGLGGYDVGITQNKVGGLNTMEFTTGDSGGNQATRLLLRGDQSSDIEFYRGNSGQEQLSMFISGNNGNVGIGTSSPSSKLTVYDGELTLRTDNDTEDQSILFQNSGGSYTWRIYRSDAGSNNADLKFASGLSTNYNSLTDRMIIDKNGNVGIGTNSPSGTLHVAGNGGNQLLVEPVANTMQDAAIKVIGHRNGSTAYDQAMLVFQNYDNDISSTNSLGMISGKVTDHNSNLGDMVFYNYSDGIYPVETMRLTRHGNVGIGTDNTFGYRLAVNGTIGTKEVNVEISSPWPDFVFSNDYALPTLNEVEAHIKENGHLKGIPSEAEVKENGINLGDMNAKLLEKIEELTLYMIQLHKKVEKLEAENDALKANANIKE